jgi:hypothetical protein
VGSDQQTTLGQEAPIIEVKPVVIRRESFRGFYRRSGHSIGAVIIVYVAPAHVEVGTLSVHNASSEYGF